MEVQMDPTEQLRREMLPAGQPARDLADDAGPRWTPAQMREEFEVLG